MNFGETIHAARFRWHRLPGNRQGLARMRPSGPNTVVELRPLGRVPGERRHDTGFYIWWQPDGGRELIESSPVLRAIREVRRPFDVVLGEKGELVE